MSLKMQQPEYRQSEEFQNRLRKLQEIRDCGIEPYPHKFSPTHQSEDLHITYDTVKVGSSEDAEASKTPFVSVAGRLVLFRSMGKNAFLTIQDKSGKIQVMLNRDKTILEGLSQEHLSKEEAVSALKFIEKNSISVISSVLRDFFFIHTKAS